MTDDRRPIVDPATGEVIDGWYAHPAADLFPMAHWGTNCYGCGLTVDMQADSALPHGPTIEHVIPIAHGGSNDIANLRISHRRCNLVKGTKAS